MSNNGLVIAGGAGFIGSALVRELTSSSGIRIDVLDNLSTGKWELLPDGQNDVEAHEFDIRNAGRLRSLFNSINPKTVIHLAASHYIPWCNEHPTETIDNNVRGTSTLLREAVDAGCNHFVFASSAAVYPIGDRPHSEADPIAATDIYGMSKVVGEDLCRWATGSGSVGVTILRFFNVYGPRETNPHLIPEIVDQVGTGRGEVSLGNLRPQRDYVHVADVARAVAAAIASPPATGELRTYNVGSGSERSVREVVEAIGRALEVDLRITSDAARRRAADRMHLCADISKIKDELSWSPSVGFDQGIAALLDNMP